MIDGGAAVELAALGEFVLALLGARVIITSGCRVLITTSLDSARWGRQDRVALHEWGLFSRPGMLVVATLVMVHRRRFHPHPMVRLLTTV